MFGPDGAEGCSHGWSSPKANGTRGTVATQPARPSGAEDGPMATRRQSEHLHAPCLQKSEPQAPARGRFQATVSLTRRLRSGL